MSAQQAKDTESHTWSEREGGKKGAESREQEEGDTQTEFKRDAHTNRLEGADAYVTKHSQCCTDSSLHAMFGCL